MVHWAFLIPAVQVGVIIGIALVAMLQSNDPPREKEILGG